jgi:hypothetical protein
MKRLYTLLAVTVIVLHPFDVLSQSASESWWLTNSLKQSEKHEGIRFHAQGEYSTYIATGQVDTYYHNSSPKLFVRNGRAQISAFGTISYQKVRVKPDPAIRTRTFSFNPKLIYDL